MRWTLQEIAQALGVAVPPGLAPLARLAGVSIDSRAVGREQLFIAIRGPRHDGHDFVAAALQAGAEAAVVELGMSHRGELRRLAEIAEPEVGVVTRVAPVHLEFFGSIDEIALAKRELIEGLAGPEPVAVLNADDPRVARFAEVARGRVLTFGYGSSAQFRAEKILDHGAAGSEFDFVAPGERARLALALPGR